MDFKHKNMSYRSLLFMSEVQVVWIVFLFGFSFWSGDLFTAICWSMTIDNPKSNNSCIYLPQKSYSPPPPLSKLYFFSQVKKIYLFPPLRIRFCYISSPFSLLFSLFSPFFFFFPFFFFPFIIFFPQNLFEDISLLYPCKAFNHRISRDISAS